MTTLSSGRPTPIGYSTGVAGEELDLLTCGRCGTLIDRTTGLDRHERWHRRAEADPIPRIAAEIRAVVDQLRKAHVSAIDPGPVVVSPDGIPRLTIEDVVDLVLRQLDPDGIPKGEGELRDPGGAGVGGT